MLGNNASGSDVKLIIPKITTIINAIIVALVMRNEEGIAKKFTALENIWDEYQVYEKPIDKE